ncbi:MAG: class A beta-lactamase-related serine hydrolase [Anaerolineae bacterium]|jgi:hypothetical protein|nr:class A beta-lactamase-related serine hydrolase [Anaerolineae bacterium]
MLNRRDLLTGLGAGVILASLRLPMRAQTRLERDLLDIIGDQTIGFDLRQLDDQQQVIMQIQHNADQRYPVASCFKAFVVFYYFWHTPIARWQVDRESAAYRVAVFSDNVQTGFLIRDVGENVDVYGNALQKFNDCLLYDIGMSEGIYTWDWPGNPLIGFADDRFAPSEARVITLRGETHSADNLTTAQDLARGYTFLAQAADGALPPNPLQPKYDFERAQRAAQATLDLLAIPAANYRSPLERAGWMPYIGKDGILPRGDLSVGNVVNDAGLITQDETRYVIAYLSVGQTEYSAINTLTAMAERMRAG